MTVMLSAIAVQPENAGAKYTDFLMRGFAVKKRFQLWEPIAGYVGKEPMRSDF